jgi:hypothetical protein
MKKIGYSGYRFPMQIIQLYLRFTLSFRDASAQIVLNGDDLRLKRLAMGQEHPQFLTA